MEITIDVRGVKEVEDLFLFDRILDESKSLFVRDPHHALDGCCGVVSHLL